MARNDLAVTVKEHLHALVDSLTDEQARWAERALALVVGQSPAPLPDRASPFVGKFASGHTRHLSTSGRDPGRSGQ